MAYAVAILLIVLLAWLVIPQIVNSIVMLFTNFPSYIQGVQDLLVMMQDRYGIDLQQAIKMLDDSEAMVKEVYSLATAAMPQIVDSIGSVASNFWASLLRWRPVSICWRIKSICSTSCAR